MAGSGTHWAHWAHWALGSWESPQSTHSQGKSEQSTEKSRLHSSQCSCPGPGCVGGLWLDQRRWGQSGKWRLSLAACTCMACHDLGPPQPALSLSPPQADRACPVRSSLHDKDAASIATVCDWPRAGSVRQAVAASSAVSNPATVCFQSVAHQPSLYLTLFFFPSFPLEIAPCFAFSLLFGVMVWFLPMPMFLCS